MKRCRLTADKRDHKHAASVDLNVQIAILTRRHEAETDDFCECCWEDEDEPGDGHCWKTLVTIT